MAHVIAIVNQKGGVGKTTTAVNLGAGLAAAGRRTLVVDCDPQANASRSLGIGDGPRSLYDALVPEDPTPLADVVVSTSLDRLDLVPSSQQLAGAEVELVRIAGRERRLRDALSGLGDTYRYVLVDCPPSLGLLSVNALVAAQRVIVPVQCEFLPLAGLGQLTKTLDLVRMRLNPELRIAGLLMTMYDSRTNLANQVVAEVDAHFPNDRFETIVPRTVRLSEAPSYAETIFQYAPDSPGAAAYLALAGEVIGRLENGRAGR